MRPYSERVIHGEIFKARPDVNAVCHHHAPAIMPFAISGVPLVPVFHLGAAMGQSAPFWDSRDEFGDTNLLVVKPEEGASLARALGQAFDRGDAPPRRDRRRRRACANSCSARIYSAKNAEHQLAAHMLGHVSPLTPGEAEMAGELNLAPGPLARAYEYWVRRLAEREGRAKSDPSVRAADAAARQPNPGAATPAKQKRGEGESKPKAKGEEAMRFQALRRSRSRRARRHAGCRRRTR